MSVLGSERWRRLWQEMGGQGDGLRCYELLVQAYAEPPRHYHNLRHIAECLEAFDSASHLAPQPQAVEAAIWFHDAVYDPKAADNEERSAELAGHWLSGAGRHRRVVEIVRQLILSTKAHAPGDDVNGSLLMDVDLSILGKPEDRFQEYEAQIRAEYAWVPEAVYAAKRSEIFERFLGRERIFTTDWFHYRFENQARNNIRRSLRQLRPAGA